MIWKETLKKLQGSPLQDLLDKVPSGKHVNVLERLYQAQLQNFNGFYTSYFGVFDGTSTIVKVVVQPTDNITNGKPLNVVTKSFELNHMTTSMLSFKHDLYSQHYLGETSKFPTVG